MRHSNIHSYVAIEPCEPRRLFTVSFADAVLYTLPAADDSAAVVTADFNGDGKLDAAALNRETASVYVALGNGDGTLGAIQTTAVDATAQDMAVGDFNGDGKADLALAVSGNFGPVDDDEVHVLINNGDGTLAAPLVSSAEGVGIFNIAAADLNGDGKADVVVGDALTENNLGVLLNTGTGLLGEIATFNVNHATTDIALGDINNDGTLDIVAGLDDGFGASLLNNGSGGFAQPVVFQTAQFDSTRVEGVVLGNVVGDANVDLIVMSEDGEGFATLAGNGDGTFGAIVQQDDGTRDDGLAADFDGDGDLDVVTTDGLFGELEAYTRADDASFNRTMFDFPGLHTYFIAAGDFNNDGRLDVVTTGERSNGEGGEAFLGIYLNTSAGDTTPPPPPAEEDPAIDLAASDLKVTYKGASAIGGLTKGSATVKVTNAALDKYTGTVNVSFYASLDGTVDGADTLIASVDKSLTINSTKSKSVKASFVFPSVADGSYTILAKVTSAVMDEQAANDVATAPAPVTIAAPFVDLVGQSLVVKSKGDARIATVTKAAATFKFVNEGNVSHTGPLTVNFYVSTDGVVDGGDALMGTVAKSLTVKSGATKSVKGSFVLPNVADGTYTLLARVEPVTSETAANNNEIADVTQVVIAQPFVDLSGAFTKTPATWAIDKKVSTSLKVQNDGNVPAKGDLVVRYYVSTDATLDGADVLVGEFVKSANIKAGSSAARRASLELPDAFAAGAYYLIASINPDATITESSLANNVTFSVTPIAVG